MGASRVFSAVTCALWLAASGCTCDPTLANIRNLTVTTLGEGDVTVDPLPREELGGGKRSFPKGTVVTLRVALPPGGNFEGWDGACTGTDPACAVTLDSDFEVIARFSVGLTVAFEGTGRVVSTPAGLDCTTGCSHVFPYDNPVSLAATAGAGFRFESWAGDCSGAAACTLATDVRHTVTARFVAAPAPCDWVKRFGGPYRETFGGLSRNAATGRLLLAGTTQGNIDFGGGALTGPIASHVFVAVLDAAGAYQSAFMRGRMSQVTLGDGAAWLPNGDVAVAGAWSGTVDFGDGTLRDDAAAGFGLFRGFFATWSPTGTLKSFQPLGETTVLLSGFSAITTNAATGRTTLAGTFAAAEGFGGPALLSPADFDAYTAQYDADGGFRWARQGGGASYDQAFAAASMADGTTLVAGTVNGLADFGGVTFDAGQFSGAYVVGYGADGGIALSEFIAPADVDGGSGAEAHGVVAMPSGGVVVAGSYSGQVVAGGIGSPQALGTAPGYDGFVARLGATPWFARLGGTLFDEAVAVVVDPSNEDLWVLGDFRGTVTFQTAPVTSKGGGDIFLAHFSKTGQLLGVRTFGGPGEDFARGLQLDPFGRVLVAGEFESTADFGVGTLTSGGDVDLFLGCFVP